MNLTLFWDIINAQVSEDYVFYTFTGVRDIVITLRPDTKTFLIFPEAQGQLDNNTDADWAAFTEINNNNNNNSNNNNNYNNYNNNTALSVTTEEDDVISTTEFTMTEPDNWLEFFPIDQKECRDLAFRIRLIFNFTQDHLYCYCYGLQNVCPEPYKSMPKELFEGRLNVFTNRLIEAHFKREKGERIALYTLYGVTCVAGVFGKCDPFYRPHSEGRGKVIFSQVSVCPLPGGYPSLWSQVLFQPLIPGPPEGPNIGQAPPPRSQDWGTLPWDRRTSTCYAAGGASCGFPQEDFLVR